MTSSENNFSELHVVSLLIPISPTITCKINIIAWTRQLTQVNTRHFTIFYGTDFFIHCFDRNSHQQYTVLFRMRIDHLGVREK